MAGGVNALGNLQGKVNASNALVVTLDGGVGSATVFLAGDGTAAAPAFSFTSDPTNGMYLSAVDTLGFSTAGVERVTLTSSGTLTVTNKVLAGSFGPLAGAAFVGATSGDGGTIVLLNGTETGFTRLNYGPAGAATTASRVQKKVTGIADAVATAVMTVTVPNANHAAGILLKFVSSNGSTDAFESARVAMGMVAITRTTGVATVAVAAALESAAIATVAAGATHTLAYSVSAMTGAVGAQQTFTVNVTIDDSGNLGSSQVVVLWELINAEATGVTAA